jgi:hypothetical protein
MSLAAIKYQLLLSLKNIPGPSVKEKIVVIESDDYGGIRMPSEEAYKKMQHNGAGIATSRYNLYDTLEDKEDLENLFEVLTSVKDKNGNHAVVSPFVNVANPDFDKIKASDFQQYYYEPFILTLQKYARHSRTMDVWREGMTQGIFMPEFHGREHLSVQPWMQKLKEGNKKVLAAFNERCTAVGSIEGIHKYANEFRPEFYFVTEKEKSFLHHSITEGVKLFEQLFGYTPNAFVPSNSVFHPDFEDTVLQAGVPFLGVSHKNPTPGLKGELTFSKFTFRQQIQKDKLNFYIRNCAFEPSDNSYTSVDLTMKQIAAAFRWGKPAIISTHRVNFTGGISKANGDKGLTELKTLLQKIVAQWPDVRFMSTGKMLAALKNNK